MPELPEVETIRKYLKKEILGMKIKKIDIFSKKQFLSNPKEIIGEKILALKRKGKLLILSLTNRKNLLVHLKLSGQLIWLPNQRINYSSPTKRVIIYFDGGKLVFNEPRKFGWLRVLNNEGLKIELKKIGPDPLSKKFTLDYLEKIFSKSKREIKNFLLDQKKISGLGNIYSSEALFLAKIHPERKVFSLTKREIKRLYGAIKMVLKDGLKYEGTSLRYYIKPNGTKGFYQEHFRVYQREGKNCYLCSSKIQKIKQSGRSTFFCPLCQKKF